MLTPRQSALLRFIVAYQDKHGGASPSLDEMRVALSLKRKSSVHKLLGKLEERGFVRRGAPYSNRAVEVLRDGVSCITYGPWQPVFLNNELRAVVRCVYRTSRAFEQATDALAA